MLQHTHCLFVTMFTGDITRYTGDE